MAFHMLMCRKETKHSLTPDAVSVSIIWYNSAENHKISFMGGATGWAGLAMAVAHPIF